MRTQRYARTFERLRAENRTALVPFAVAGDPDLGTSEAVFRTFIDSGADIVEIGYPFSDPIADGPVNQRAAQRAIAAGLTHETFFSLVKRLRAYTDIPFGALLYANSVLHLGVEKFCARAAEAGLDSLLVADMPPEEASHLMAALEENGLCSVLIVSELTPPERIKRICSQVNGFVYVVSRLGPTGVQSAVDQTVARTLSRLRESTNLPLCVGFGLSKPEHVRAVREAGADGAIVGSALVSLVEAHSAHTPAMLKALSEAVRNLRTATLPA